MRQLRGEDARFVYAESGHSNSNITLVHIYDPSTAPGGRVRFKGFLKYVESRLHLSPIFRQKLLRVPLDLDHPYWIEDERFDLEYHVRHIALPRPGDWRQFCIQASRIHARPLDLSRPLWELYLVEGLDTFLNLPPDSFAILTKIHHAAIDVKHGAEITTLLHDTTPLTPHPEPPEPWFPESPPGPISLLARAALHNAVQPFMVAAPLTRAVRRVAPAILGTLSEMWLHPERLPITRFNAEVSPHRVFETRRFTLDEFRRIRALAPRATINDAVLAVCGGALRRYLVTHDELPGPSLVAMAPLSIRNADTIPGRREAGFSLLRLPLGTEIEDAVERLRSVTLHTANAQDIDQAVGAKELTDITKHAPAATLAVTARLLAGSALGLGQRAPLASCTVTNVPGPAIPLYLNGARMTYFSAIMPISDGMGLVFAITSYDGRIIISPTSCREQIPDPEFFALCIRESFQEYLELADRAARRRAAELDTGPGGPSKPTKSAKRARAAKRAAPKKAKVRSRSRRSAA
jgi:diacylglycerol O-acyltransferase